MVEAALILGRALQFAAAVVLFGTPLFCLYGFPRTADAGESGSWIRPVLRASSFAALAAAFMLLSAQTAEMSGDPRDALNLDTIWAVVSDTHVGRVWLLRLPLILIAISLALWAPRRLGLWAAQALVGAGLAASLSWSGHGAQGDGPARVIHQFADGLHLLAAGAWLGALPPLAMLLVRAARQASQANLAHFALARFSGIGPAVVAVLVLTGLINSWFLIGPQHLAAAVASPYFWVLMIKLGLFAAMLALAAANRFLLTPRLARDLESGPGAVVTRLKRSVCAETALAALVIAAVAVLGTLAPPIAGEGG